VLAFSCSTGGWLTTHLDASIPGKNESRRARTRRR